MPAEGGIVIQKSDFCDELSSTDLVGVFETGESNIELTWVRDICVFSTLSELLEELKKQGAPYRTVLVESERVRRETSAFLEVMELNLENRAHIIVSNESYGGKAAPSLEFESLVASVSERICFVDQEMPVCGEDTPQQHGPRGENPEATAFLQELQGDTKIFSEDSRPRKRTRASRNRLSELLRRLYPFFRKWIPAKAASYAIVLLRRIESVWRGSK